MKVRLDPPVLALSRMDAAASLGIEGKTFDRWVRPHLKSVWIGASERFPVSELERFLLDGAEPLLRSSPATTKKRRGAARTAPGMAQEENPS